MSSIYRRDRSPLDDTPPQANPVRESAHGGEAGPGTHLLAPRVHRNAARAGTAETDRQPLIRPALNLGHQIFAHRVLFNQARNTSS